MAVLLVVLALVGVMRWWVLSPQRLGVLAAGTLSGMVGGEARVERASIDLVDGVITMHGVTIRAAGWAGPGGEVFRAERIVADCRPRPLWLGRVVCERVTLDAPTFTLAEDVSASADPNRRFNVQMLNPPPGEGRVHVPAVDFRGARLRYAESAGTRFDVLGEIGMVGRVKPDPQTANAFVIRIAETRDGDIADHGLGVVGRFNVRAGTADAEIGGLGFTGRYRNLLPRTQRQWWNDLEPTGQISGVRFRLDPESGWAAQVTFDDVAMTLPQLTDADYRFRMNGVSGMFEFTADGFRIVEDHALVGTIEGLSYRVDGYSGYDPEGPFRLALQTGALEVPREPRYIYALPSAVQEVFRMLTPEGRISVSMMVWRDRADAPIDYTGTATILSGKGRYARFPYELNNCRGKVKFNADRIKVLSLTGLTAGGGSATINGVISPPNEFPAIDLTVTAVNIPLDQTLYAAMDPLHRTALEMFFHEPSYERMRREGHFITVSEYNADEMALAQVRRALAEFDPNDPDRRRYEQQRQAIRHRLDQPAFELGGLANAVVHVRRDPGPEARTTATTEVDIHEASVVLSLFPYPLRVTGGRLRIDPSRVVMRDIQAEGLHGGAATLDGSVGFDHRQGVQVQPDVDITASDVPIDELLFDALPQPQDQWVRKLHPTGRMHIAGNIYSGADDQPDMDLKIDLADVRMQPGGGAFGLEQVAGRINLSLDGVQLEQITGRRGRSTIQLDGRALWTDPNDLTVALQARAQELDFSDPLLDLVRPFIDVDPQWGRLIESYDPAGRFDVDLAYDTTADAPERLRLTVLPGSFAATYAGKRYAFDQTAGRVIVRDDRVVLDGVSAEIEDGNIAVSGAIGLEPARRADLAVTARGGSISRQLLGVLPESIAQLVESLEAEAAYDVRLSEVTVRPDAAPGRPRLRVRGEARLRDGACNLGLPVTDFNGTIDLDAVVHAGRAWPTLDLAVNAKRLKLADRRVSDFTARFVSADDSGLVVVPRMRGAMFDGVIGGSGSIDLERGGYGFHLALSEVDLATFMAAGDRRRIAADAAPTDPPAPSTPADPAQAMSGKLSAAFSIEGRSDKPQSLRARGDIQIRDAELYDLPLSLGLLQVTHLALPTSRSFNKAQISYYMQDGRIHFERLALESPTMRLAGEGSMDYTSGALDLTLTSSNPAGLDLGPVTDLIDGLRNELVTIRITGTLDEPVSRVQQLSGITQAWQDVFGEDG